MSPNLESVFVSGITCQNCARSIEIALKDLKLINVIVDAQTGEINFKNPEKVNKKTIDSAIKELGYKIKSSEQSSDYKKTRRLFFISLVFTIPLFSNMFFSENHILKNPIFQFCLALPVFIIGLLYFGKSAFYSLKSKVPNMDVLIFMGSSSAFIYSIIISFLILKNSESQMLFFETSSGIITLVLLGNLIEKKSLSKTNSTIQRLKKIQPTKAKRINPDLSFTEIEAQQILLGDKIIINEGDFIPADGIIETGSCDVNESMITGESIPVKKTKGALIFTGSKLINGNITIIVTKTSSDNHLSEIINLIKQSQLNPPKIQTMGDYVSSIFVPIVIILALLTFFIGLWAFDLILSEALTRGISVLVISCPCAMGLATPTAVMTGINKAAKKGILIKSGNVLEKLAKVKNIIFDKTGTLTTGKFKIDSLVIDENFNKKEIYTLLYEIEKHSSHVIAKSIVRETKDKRDKNTKEKISDIKEIRGVGMAAKDKENNIYSIESSEKKLFDLILKKNKKIIASLKIKDEIKPKTKNCIASLKSKKIIPILVSGDSKEKCETLAKEINISTIHSRKKPNEKYEIIKNYSKQRLTAMVGDGINDAPALTQANIGISFASATQIAIDSADIVLLSKDINSIYQAYLISRQTLTTIKQNLFWALFYNVIAIPYVMFFGISPIIAVGAMALSDVFVIGNSLRINIKK